MMGRLTDAQLEKLVLYFDQVLSGSYSTGQVEYVWKNAGAAIDELKLLRAEKNSGIFAELLEACRGWKKSIEANRTNWSSYKTRKTLKLGRKIFKILEGKK